MIHKQTIGNELYVYMNGFLLYKRWLDQGHGIIFDIWGSPWRPKFYRLVAFIILLALPFVGLGQSNKPYTRAMSLPDSVTTFRSKAIQVTVPDIDTIPGMCMIGKRGEVDMVWSRPCRYFNKKYFYGKTGVQRIDETNIVYLFVGDRKP